MPQTSIRYIDQNARSNWIKLRTLVTVRWFAIAGQVMALGFALMLYDVQLDYILCGLAVGLAVVANVVAILAYPDNQRLSESATVYMLVFDILQLSLLLALTGGLNNPFALLIVAPVTIAATVLPSRLTVILGGVAILCISVIATLFIPLTTGSGETLELPHVFAFGFWVAIVTGITFIAVYTRRVTTEMTSMAEALLATQMALAREQKLTDLGGVVAATAHELGTPLATIKLVSAELMEELSDNDELLSDAKLIREQADRCRDILRSMGRAGKDDVHLRTAPWLAVVEEAAEPHLHRGKTVIFDSEPDETLPNIRRTPEVIHGLRNLIQNAVDFASDTVTVQVDWSDTEIAIAITDDGRGFSPQVINRIGDPFVRQRKTQARGRPGYEGMGLGLFIAKTLLERSGATLRFANRDEFDPSIGSGAVVQVTWNRTQLEVLDTEIGENQPIPV